jgi:hypothetical protein
VVGAAAKDRSQELKEVHAALKKLGRRKTRARTAQDKALQRRADAESELEEARAVVPETEGELASIEGGIAGRERQLRRLEETESRALALVALLRSPVGRRQCPAADRQQRAEDQEHHIPNRHVLVVDVMDGENLMVDQTFDEVEQAPSEEHRSDQGSARDDRPPPGRRPEHEQPRQRTDEGQRVKETVGERVGLKPDHGARRVITRARQQVVPLQDLVEQDPVKKAAESDPEQDAGAKSRRARTGRPCDPLGHLAESDFRLELSQTTR